MFIYIYISFTSVNGYQISQRYPILKSISFENFMIKLKELLIYKRKLEKGSGPAIYGLEVCKSLSLGDDFISLARKSFKWK